MSHLEKQFDRQKSISTRNVSSGNKNQLLVEVACEDRRLRLAVPASATAGDLKYESLGKMELVLADPQKYIVIGSNGVPVDDNQTMRDMMAKDLTLEFRLIKPAAFGHVNEEK